MKKLGTSGTGCADEPIDISYEQFMNDHKLFVNEIET